MCEMVILLLYKTDICEFNIISKDVFLMQAIYAMAYIKDRQGEAERVLLFPSIISLATSDTTLQLTCCQSVKISVQTPLLSPSRPCPFTHMLLPIARNSGRAFISLAVTVCQAHFIVLLS